MESLIPISPSPSALWNNSGANYKTLPLSIVRQDPLLMASGWVKVKLDLKQRPSKVSVHGSPGISGTND